MNRRVGRKKNIYEKIGMQPHGATDSASDFGSEGWGFESLWGCFLNERPGQGRTPPYYYAKVS